MVVKVIVEDEVRLAAPVAIWHTSAAAAEAAMPSQPATLRALPRDGSPTAVPSPESLPSLIVRGPRKAVAAARVIARVAWLALRLYRNPIRAARALVRLHARMQAEPQTTPGRKPLWTSRKCVRNSGRDFWDLYVAGFPSAAFDRGVEWELHQVDPTGRPAGWQAAIISVTRRCSLECEHCAEGDALNRPETLSAADLHEIVRRAQQRGTPQIFFSGGEPLHRFDDLVSLAAAASVESDVWILTSGRGLTANRARRLRSAGVTGVSISLDHWDPAEHDRFRGAPGAFNGVRHAAGQARAAGLLIALSLCPTRSFVTAENLRRYGETARELGASFIQILEPRPVGRYAGRDVALEAGHQRLLEAFCDRLNTDPAATDHPSVRYLARTARTSGCGGGSRYVYIDSEACVHACPFCRGSGVRLLDRDFEAGLGELQRAGCASASDDHVSTMRTLLWTR